MDIFTERAQFAERKLRQLSDRLTRQEVVHDPETTCIYVTGSFGRKEASLYSDLDLFFVKATIAATNGFSRVDKTLMDAKLIHICSELDFPPFSNDGDYLEVHDLDEILESIGSPEDDVKNYFTARMLLLLESRAVFNDRVYDEAVDRIISAYFRDYHDHEKDFQPIFLVNDIQRYWKTLCLNYEHKRNRRVPEGKKNKIHMKNFKLKFSRMLTCYSMVAGIYALSGGAKPDDIRDLVSLTPLERLDRIAEARPALGAMVNEAKGHYAWFLERTGATPERALAWIGDRASRDAAFGRAREFDKVMYKIVTGAPDDPDKIRYLVI